MRAILLFAVLCSTAVAHRAQLPPALQAGLSFYASFDQGADADFGSGKRSLFWAPAVKFPPDRSAGLPPSGYVTREVSGGLSGGYLRFHKQSPEMIFFEAKDNFEYRSGDWAGTVSLWLKLTPDEDLAPGYTDPIQITSKSWDNAAFFVEFTRDEKPREFRLGAYADFNVWNPAKRDWNAIPMAEKPLVPVVRPPFSRDRWTHVAFTFEKFNTGEPNGVATLFLNGEKRGSLTPRVQTFTWTPDQALIMVGLSYIGALDELALFRRALSPAEIATLAQTRSHLLPR